MKLSDPVAIQLIVSGFSTLSAAFAAWSSRTAASTSSKTHDAVNSRMDKFLEMAEQTFKAQGKLEGVAEQKSIDSAAGQGQPISKSDETHE